jgi:hypothetical protein
MKSLLQWSLLGIGLLMLFSGTAQAGFIMSLRASGVTGTGNSISSDGMTVLMLNPGVISFSLWATMDGGADGDPTNDGLISFSTSVTGNLGTGAQGDVTSSGRTFPDWRGLGGQDGTIQDLNGDGYADIGGTVPTAVTYWMHARATVAPFPVMGPAPMRVFDLAYSVTNVTAGGTDSKLVVGRRNNMTGALFYEDRVWNPNNLQWEGGTSYTASSKPSGYVAGAGLTLRALLAGDANQDGAVDVSDLSKALANYDKTGMQWTDGDFDGNGTVDVSDLSKILANYDKTYTAAGPGLKAVPEPSSLVLAVLAVVGELAWLGKKR